MDPFEIPEDIKALDDDALRAAIDAAMEEGVALAEKPDADLTPEEEQRLADLAEFVQAARAEDEERAQAASARSERLSSARDAFAAPAAGEDTETPDATEEEGEQPKAEDAEEEPAEEEPAEEQEPEEEPKKKDTASTRRNVTARAARRAPKHEENKRTVATITAAADIGGGFATGQRLDTMSQVAEAVNQRLRGMSGLSGGERRRNRYGVARFAKQHVGTAFTQDNRDFRDDTDLLMAASKESRLKGGSLVAAGGWGAPSETILDLCGEDATAEGLLDIPEVTITRGGVRYARGRSFSDILAVAIADGEGFFHQTEAEAEAGEEKPSMRPDVPDFTETRLDAVGVFVEAGLLLRSAWPEVIEDFVGKVLLANQHRVARKTLTGIQNIIGAPVDVTTGAGNALDVLHILELAAIGERERNRMSLGATLEVILPHWVKAVIRADLANRNGVDYLSVTDAQIEAWFSQRGLRTQFIYNHQELDTSGGIATAYPDTIEAIMYPAGTFVKGTSDVITLDTVYDSTNLRVNDYIHLFAEEGLLVANPCGDGRRINVPLVINGRSAAADLTTDYLTTAQAAG